MAALSTVLGCLEQRDEGPEPRQALGVGDGRVRRRGRRQDEQRDARAETTRLEPERLPVQITDRGRLAPALQPPCLAKKSRHPRPEITMIPAERLIRARAKTLIVAPGLIERPYVFTGNDLPLFLSTTKAERAEGGWNITGHKIFGSLSPVWDYLGFHAMDTSDPNAPKIVHAFMGRDNKLNLYTGWACDAHQGQWYRSAPGIACCAVPGGHGP